MIFQVGTLVSEGDLNFIYIESFPALLQIMMSVLLKNLLVKKTSTVSTILAPLAVKVGACTEPKFSD